MKEITKQQRHNYRYIAVETIVIFSTAIAAVVANPGVILYGLYASICVFLGWWARNPEDGSAPAFSSKDKESIAAVVEVEKLNIKVSSFAYLAKDVEYEEVIE